MAADLLYKSVQLYQELPDISAKASHKQHSLSVYSISMMCTLRSATVAMLTVSLLPIKGANNDTMMA